MLSHKKSAKLNLHLGEKGGNISANFPACFKFQSSLWPNDTDDSHSLQTDVQFQIQPILQLLQRSDPRFVFKTCGATRIIAPLAASGYDAPCCAMLSFQFWLPLHSALAAYNCHDLVPLVPQVHWWTFPRAPDLGDDGIKPLLQLISSQPHPIVELHLSSAGTRGGGPWRHGGFHLGAFL